ncbi:MAG TPA: hypothetical protein ENF23_06050 [Methanosarcinales archaeon]|nr:hypothetical protein [Methanosarcinales archaeon]
MKLKQVVLIGSAIMCVFATSALAAQMSVEPVYQEAFQGDNITVNVTVATEGAENIYAASYTLYFNNTLLNATSLDKGPFLTQDGNPSNIPDPPTGIDNAAGAIKYGECKAGVVPGITGYGVLSTITFQVIGEEGISQLDLSDLNLALLYSAPPEYVPVPTTLNNGTCEIGAIIKQTPTSTPPTTATIVTASVQTPTAILNTPAPTATVIRTTATLPSPSPSPPSTILISPTTTASKPPSEEESEENNKLSGFKAVFTITGLFILLILKKGM